MWSVASSGSRGTGQLEADISVTAAAARPGWMTAATGYQNLCGGRAVVFVCPPGSCWSPEAAIVPVCRYCRREERILVWGWGEGRRRAVVVFRAGLCADYCSRMCSVASNRQIFEYYPMVSADVGPTLWDFTNNTNTT